MYSNYMQKNEKLILKYNTITLINTYIMPLDYVIKSNLLEYYADNSDKNELHVCSINKLLEYDYIADIVIYNDKLFIRAMMNDYIDSIRFNVDTLYKIIETLRESWYFVESIASYLKLSVGTSNVSMNLIDVILSHYNFSNESLKNKFAWLVDYFNKDNDVIRWMISNNIYDNKFNGHISSEYYEILYYYKYDKFLIGALQVLIMDNKYEDIVKIIQYIPLNDYIKYLSDISDGKSTTIIDMLCDIGIDLYVKILDILVPDSSKKTEIINITALKKLLKSEEYMYAIICHAIINIQ